MVCATHCSRPCKGSHSSLGLPKEMWSLYFLLTSANTSSFLLLKDKTRGNVNSWHSIGDRWVVLNSTPDNGLHTWLQAGGFLQTVNVGVFNGAQQVSDRLGWNLQVTLVRGSVLGSRFGTWSVNLTNISLLVIRQSMIWCACSAQLFDQYMAVQVVQYR